MLADILNVQVCTINTTEGGALGAVILAMVGCGRYQDVATACKHIIHDTKVFTPNVNKHKYYVSKFTD
jgi:xylulokinase